MMEIEGALQLDLLPMRVAVTEDMTCIQFYDNVDYYRHAELKKAQVAELAEELRQLAALMKE
jgi:hypothetical protein